ncbi:hypothetical protein RQN30_11135 [Arcanobacterium hippocoleae]
MSWKATLLIVVSKVGADGSADSGTAVAVPTAVNDSASVQILAAAMRVILRSFIALFSFHTVFLSSLIVNFTSVKEAVLWLSTKLFYY